MYGCLNYIEEFVFEKIKHPGAAGTLRASRDVLRGPEGPSGEARGSLEAFSENRQYIKKTLL